MALKSIIDIEVNSSEFQRFSAMFDKYKASLQNTPHIWQQAAASATQTAKATHAAAVSTTAQAQATHIVFVQQNAIGRAAAVQARHWDGLAKNAQKFSLHIVEATRSLLRWGALTGLISGVMGLGGLFGIERLATSAATQRKEGFGLGVTPGEQKAFETTMSRLTDPKEFLSNIATGMSDLQSPQYLALHGLGLSGEIAAGASTAQVATDALEALKRKADAIPLGPAFGPTMHNQFLDQLLPMQDIRTVKRTPGDEIQDLIKRFHELTKSMELPSGVAKAWQELQTTLVATGETIKQHLIVRLTELAPSIEHLSNSFLHMADIVMNNEHMQKWIDDLAGAIDNFAVQLKDPKMVQNVDSFMATLDHMETGVKDFALHMNNFVGGIDGFITGVHKFDKYLNDTLDEVQNFGKRLHELIVGFFKGILPDSLPGPSSFNDPTSSGEFSAPMPPTAVQKQTFQRLEGQNDLPGGLLNAVFQTESGGGRNMLSPAGAKGPFQFMDATAARYDVQDPFDFGQSATGAAHYFHDLLDEFHGDVGKAAAGYNWGEGNVERSVKMYGENWRSDPRMPQETRQYIDKITSGLGGGSRGGDDGGSRRGGPGFIPATRVPTVLVNVSNSTSANVVVSSSQLSF